MKRFTLLTFTLLFSFAVGACAPVAEGPTCFLPNKIHEKGEWFCCDAQGNNCTVAVSACAAGDKLAWCDKTGTDEQGETVCLD